MKEIDEFPKEFYIDLIGDSFLLGRIIISKTHKDFMVELDLITKESRKIYKHLNTFFSNVDEREIVDDAVLALRNYLR
jgi:hypothetical protein